MTQSPISLSVDALAQEIRRVDGNHSLGAAALAEALMPFLAGTQPQNPAGWRDIASAPRSYHPPLSPFNHHAPGILGLWGKAFYCVCRWGGPSNPYWIDGNNQKVPFQPTHWMPLPPPPGAHPAEQLEGGEAALNIEAAAKMLAERMDYPWESMPEKGRGHMRKHAQAVIDAAMTGGGDTAVDEGMGE